MTEPGYQIERDDDGLTRREREVLAGIIAGKNLVQIGDELGVSKQRVDQIVKALVTKGTLERNDDSFVVKIRRST